MKVDFPKIPFQVNSEPVKGTCEFREQVTINAWCINVEKNCQNKRTHVRLLPVSPQTLDPSHTSHAGLWISIHRSNPVSYCESQDPVSVQGEGSILTQILSPRRMLIDRGWSVSAEHVHIWAYMFRGVWRTRGFRDGMGSSKASRGDCHEKMSRMTN